MRDYRQRHQRPKAEARQVVREVAQLLARVRDGAAAATVPVQLSALDLQILSALQERSGVRGREVVSRLLREEWAVARSQAESVAS